MSQGYSRQNCSCRLNSLTTTITKQGSQPMPSEWMNRLFSADVETHASAQPSPASESASSAGGPVPASPANGPEITATGRRWSKRSPPGSSSAGSSPGPAGSSAAPAPPSLDDQPVPVRGYCSNSERAIFEVADQFCPHDQLVVCLYHASGKRKGKVYKAVPWNEYFEVMREIEVSLKR